MKESKGRAQVTFGSALKTVKSSITLKVSQQSFSRDERRDTSMMKSNINMLSSRKRITQRRNLTLLQIYREYEKNSGIEYVIRAKEKNGKIHRQESFEDWIKNIKQDYAVEQQPKHQRKIISKRQRKQSEKIRDQITKNISALVEKLKKKQTKTTQQSINDGEDLSNIDTKYSFSGYFSECSQIQQKDASKKPQAITKISIRNQLIPDLYMQQRGTIDLKNPSIKSPKSNLQKSDQQSEQNKQNLGSLYNAQHDHTKIIGLQFSKNKRFKSLRKKRRELAGVN